VRLSKRRQKIGVQSSSTNTRLIVRHVPINEQEFSVHKFREKQLQPYDEEEETKAEEAAKKALLGNSLQINLINNAGGLFSYYFPGITNIYRKFK